MQRPNLVLAVLVASALVSCGPAPTSSPAALAPSPSAGTPVSLAPEPVGPWQVADVALPAAVTTAPSLEPGYQCHPCHFLAEDQLFAIAPTAAGLVAVGLQQPPAQATAFASLDGRSWRLLPGFDGAKTTTAIGIASSGARSVIVGLDSSGATSWASDGGAWTQAPRQPDLLVPYAAGAMTSVTPFGGGFVAGGYRDNPLDNTASAAVWRSADGLAWQLDTTPSVFAGGRIWGITAKAGTIVAVGTNGDPNYGPVGVWRWTEGSGWQRAQVRPGNGGAMRAVLATATGFLAVGLNGHDDGAMSWSSPDGLTWTAAPDQPSFHYGQLPMRMQSIVGWAGGYLAGGWRSDQAKGSAVTWTSADGVTWRPWVWETEFSGGQITGVAMLGGTAVAVGRTGYPDWNQATVWFNPSP